MSDAPPPPTPEHPVVLGPPQRPTGVRRLGNVPYWIAGGVGAAFVAFAGWAIHTRQASTDAEAPTAAAPRNGNPNVVLTSMPNSGAIAATENRQRRPASAPPGNPPPGTAPNRDNAAGTAPRDTPRDPASPPPEDIRQNALKEAWTQYYRDIAQLAATRREAAQTALKADTSYVSNADTGGNQAQPSPNGAGSGGAGSAASGQQQRRAPVPGELNQGPSRAADDYLQATVTPPLTKYELKAGDPIQIRFSQGVTSAAPGQIRAVVSQPVFDHATGLHILIPQGSIVIGSYDHLQEVGTERLPAGGTRIIFPGESSESLDLGSMPLADQSGYSGLQDQINHHYGRLILGTVLLGIGGAGAQLTQPNTSSPYGGYSASQIIAAQLGLQFGQLGSEYARQQLQAKAEHTIRPGYTGLLQLTQDVAFPGEWVEGRGIVLAGHGR